VIEAAKTKPFGYMPFYPGPGLGGHCIPIDPFYLTWKSREFDMPTRFIELAGEINLAMPRYVIARLEAALDERLAKSLGSARILIIGLAYKRNVADVRESATFKLLELLEARGATTNFHDPHVAAIPPTRQYASFAGRRSTALSPETIAAHDAVLIATDHDAVDYQLIAREARLVVDTRNALGRRGVAAPGVVKA
ncbi:MAG TPA: UDP binding domain-containing protein, partial [Caulobacteraceae bacterium]|nr:UDP binding domain-containing protein [Caulobacteraceae bacterium]